MKLKNHRIMRGNHNRLHIEAQWTDKMRRPAQVQIRLFKSDNASTLPSEVLIDDDVKEGTDVVFALAEIAWELGWRPRGLAGTVAGMIANFKIPPEGQDS
jgi:hypothetical protein